MKASELVEIWKQNGARITPGCCLTVETLKYGDPESSTTPEIVAISERFQRENRTRVKPPQSCASCHGELEKWVLGHLPDWWVCTECKTVFPCDCSPDDDGYCYSCFCKMSDEAIHQYREEEKKLYPPLPDLPEETRWTVRDGDPFVVTLEMLNRDVISDD